MSGLGLWGFLALDVLILAASALLIWIVLRGPRGGGRR